MATEFKDILFAGGEYFLTSLISDVRASTDLEKVNVSLSCPAGADGEPETFFSTSLYPFNGEVELTGVGSLIEDYFRKRGKVADTVTVQFADASVSAHFLYCEFLMPDAFDHTSTFFLASMVQRVHQDSILTIAAADRGEDAGFVIKGVGHRRDDGNTDIVSIPVSKSFTGNSVLFFVYDIIHLFIDPEGEDPSVLRDLLYFSIEYAGIRKVFYIMPSPAYITFTFRNIFNVEEFLDVEGSIKTISEVDREQAVCNGCIKQYDRNVSHRYEIKSAPMTQAEISVFEQLLSSYDVRLYLEGNSWPVIISDFTCEPSSSDEELTTITFTWSFADSRPRIFDTDLNGIMPSRHRIFNFNYSPEYD